jgi:RNA polymerase sigma-70 factor (ECF subfamily)
VAEIVLECLRDEAAVLRRFAGRSSLATYLAVIARRVTVRRLLRGGEASRLAATETPPDPVAPASDLPERIDDREQVETLLGRLDDEEARLVRLHHLEGRSYGEISRHTGLPLGSIGPALSRARAKLRTIMEDASPPG